jgi:hypothetical protein
MAGSPARQLANPDHQQWPPHNAQICPGGAERGIDAATAPNGGYLEEAQVKSQFYGVDMSSPERHVGGDKTKNRQRREADLRSGE